jgi:hypothetical protein
MALVLPGRHGARKPHGPWWGIDFAHPLALALELCIPLLHRAVIEDIALPTRTLTVTSYSFIEDQPGFAIDDTAATAVITLSPVVTLTNNWTVSSFIKFPITNNSIARLAFNGGGGPWHIHKDIGVDILGSYDSAERNFSPTIAPLTLSGWKRLTIVSQSGIGCTAYLDGVFAGSHAFAISGNIAQILGDSGSSRSWGIVSDFFVWSRSLSADEVANHAAAPFDLLRPMRRRMHFDVPAAGGRIWKLAGSGGGLVGEGRGLAA